MKTTRLLIGFSLIIGAVFAAPADMDTKKNGEVEQIWPVLEVNFNPIEAENPNEKTQKTFGKEAPKISEDLPIPPEGESPRNVEEPPKLPEETTKNAEQPQKSPKETTKNTEESPKNIEAVQKVDEERDEEPLKPHITYDFSDSHHSESDSDEEDDDEIGDSKSSDIHFDEHISPHYGLFGLETYQEESIATAESRNSGHYGGHYGHGGGGRGGHYGHGGGHFGHGGGHHGHGGHSGGGWHRG